MIKLFLEFFDDSLYKIRSEKLFESLLRVLAGRRINNIDDSLSLFDKELALFSRVLKLRSHILELLVELESYSRFKRGVLKTYTERLGISTSEKPRLRICRNYGNESVCIATNKSTRWIGDETVYREFKRYLELKKAAASTLERYRELLEQLIESDYAWVRKLARYLLREARGYKRMLRGLSSSS